ncbi:GDYXXLXY domain-containing protein [Hyphomicrobium sp. DY-1]|uniref:GDYXXLXY domain-containing protein n=1 Tax=Hyphomicrobium sp. DY-1 TaxID=3075650 RepID=UPI0039C3D6C3
MIATGKWMWPLLGGVALLQSAALFNMIHERDRLLKSGREVTLAVQPLDPRDIFRGDYVTLGYDISQIKTSATASDPVFTGFVPGGEVFVTLSAKPEGGWLVSHVSTVFPPKLAAGDLVLKGRVQSAWTTQNPPETNASVRYGIEQYFVPEGTGIDLEKKVRDHKIEAIVAVGTDGTAALKGLVIDGERHEDPPLL